MSLAQLLSKKAVSPKQKVESLTGVAWEFCFVSGLQLSMTRHINPEMASINFNFFNIVLGGNWVSRSITSLMYHKKLRSCPKSAFQLDLQYKSKYAKSRNHPLRDGFLIEIGIPI
jgi:hypothetical protein